jgi:alpha-amylase
MNVKQNRGFLMPAPDPVLGTARDRTLRGCVRSSAIAVSAVALCLSGCASGSGDVTSTPIGPKERPALSPTYRPTGRAAAGDVFVQLFDWRWNDIASECTQRLAPAGYKAVQVSPPQEHAIIAGYPWWERYQAVSYRIDKSRSGTRAEFVSMVQGCRNVGIDIYVDAIINHMTGTSGTGSAGSVYTKYEYPGLYTRADFHASCGISNYNDPANVQDCELVGLADLRTDQVSVQNKIAGYLMDLVRIGVAGFRIDAAKHIQPSELDAILAIVNRAAVAEGRAIPYVYGEVIDYGGEAVRVSDYYGLGYASGGAADLSEFKYRGLGDKFINLGTQKVADLAQFTPGAWGLIPSDKAVSFLENHDTQRDGSPISYRDAQTMRLAYVWLLGYPYGYPTVMSSYAFDRTSSFAKDRGPPSNAEGETNAVSCASSWATASVGTHWLCEHRDPTIVAMVGFRKRLAGADVSRLWTNGGNAVAFSRGTAGFVLISRESQQITPSIVTGLPAGTYCDLLTGGRVGSSCAGASAVVGPDGTATVTVPANSAIVLLAGAKL